MLLPVAGLVLFAAGLAREGEKEKYTADLQALNDSGVSGTVSLTLKGDELKLDMDVEGLEPGQPHAIQIHGFREGDRASSCPSAEADMDGNGTIGMEEFVTSAGPPLVEIRVSEDVNEQGELKTDETFRVDPSLLESLDMRLIAIHGATIDGSYDPSAPAACGRLEAKENGHGHEAEHGEQDEGMEEPGPWEEDDRMDEPEFREDYEGMEEPEGTEEYRYNEE